MQTYLIEQRSLLLGGVRSVAVVSSRVMSLNGELYANNATFSIRSPVGCFIRATAAASMSVKRYSARDRGPSLIESGAAQGALNRWNTFASLSKLPTNASAITARRAGKRAFYRSFAKVGAASSNAFSGRKRLRRLIIQIARFGTCSVQD
jgi:hypothetical protein